jgi:predicted naringenin-chalcone synthase
MSVILSNFHVLKPPNEMKQEDVSLWLAKVQSKITPETFNERIIQKFSVKSSDITKRSFFCSEFGNIDLSKNVLYTEKNKFSPNLKERSNFFRETADNIFNYFFKDVTEAPQEILHVSCTGYVSPSAGQKVIPKKEWSDSTGITHIYHMGCYAAMPAIKVAKGMTEKKRVDIVHTEICSLHLDITAQSPEQTVVQTLFADGAIKYSAFPNSSKEDFQEGISVLQLKEKIIPGSEEAMTWGFGENNLEMTLHRRVPSLIKENFKKYTEQLFKDAGFDFEKDKASTIYAIHPGGPKIIQQITALLELTDEQVRFSIKVLKERGNMSSATLPHVWNEIINDKSVSSGTKILSVAFGPGLTIAGFIGEKV